MHKFLLSCAVLLLAGSCFSMRAMDPQAQAEKVARMFVKEFLNTGQGGPHFTSQATKAAFAKKDYRLAFRTVVKSVLSTSAVSDSFNSGRVNNATFPLLVKTFASEYINSYSGGPAFSSAPISAELALL